MSRETEKFFRAFEKYLSENEFETEEELQKANQIFIEKYNRKQIGINWTDEELAREEAEDILEMAYDARTKKDRIRLAKEALNRYDKCYDASILLIESENNLEKRLRNFEGLIKDIEADFHTKGLFEEDNIGHFYGLVETRPYLRAIYSFIEDLISAKQYDRAILECEKALRLNEKDNMGIRYKLMTLYAHNADKAKANKLYEKFQDSSPSMLLPYALVCYKNNSFSRCKKIVLELNENNPFLFDIVFAQTLSEELQNKALEGSSYTIGSPEEAFFALLENSLIINENFDFLIWVFQNYYHRK